MSKMVLDCTNKGYAAVTINDTLIPCVYSIGEIYKRGGHYEVPLTIAVSELEFKPKVDKKVLRERGL